MGEQKKKDSLSTKKKGSLGVIRRRDDLKFKKYAVLSLRNKLKVKTRMTSQFSDIFQDLGTDFFQQISGEAARLANGKRVSLKEVMAAVNLVLGRSKLAERCIAAGVEAIKLSGCLKGDKGDKASSYKDKEKSADFKDKA